MSHRSNPPCQDRKYDRRPVKRHAEKSLNTDKPNHRLNPIARAKDNPRGR
jgi:hypothetical protein